jgi:hypothetical protein
MKSSSKDTVSDLDLGLFEDVLLGPGGPIVQAEISAPSVVIVNEHAARPPKPTPTTPKPEIVTIGASVQFLTLGRGAYTVTIVGGASGIGQSHPHALAAVDVVLVPGQAADAATLISVLTSEPPWSCDRDVTVNVNVVADSAQLCVITYQPEVVTAASLLRVDTLSQR